MEEHEKRPLPEARMYHEVGVVKKIAAYSKGRRRFKTTVAFSVGYGFLYG